MYITIDMNMASVPWVVCICETNIHDLVFVNRGLKVKNCACNKPTQFYVRIYRKPCYLLEHQAASLQT